MLLQYFICLCLIFWSDFLDLVVDIFVNPLLDAVVVEGVLAGRNRNLFIRIKVICTDRTGFIIEFVLV